MSSQRAICAVIPVKEAGAAKQRLADALSPAQRRQLAYAMLEDVLATLAGTVELASILVVTADPGAAAIAASYGAEISDEAARAGHSAAVAAAALRLDARGFDMLALPADIPLVQSDDIQQLIAAHADSRSDEQPGPSFTIVPARNERGSNAVACSPAGAVPLRFGEDSFFPHLAAAKARGIEPAVLRLPRVALDIDNAQDLDCLLEMPIRTRAQALLAQWGITAPCIAARHKERRSSE